MDWQQELHQIVESRSLIPTFQEWLDTTGYSEYARGICAGSINVQATAMNALYEYYQREMRKRPL